jgi:hypothetical protein
VRKRLQIALAVFLLSIPTTIGWQVLHRDEPVYQGKQVHEWLRDMDYGGGRRYRTAAGALRHIGTNALPTLKRYLAYRDPTWKSPLARLKARTRLFGIEENETDWHRRAAKACGELGSQATPVIPALAAAANDPQAADAVVRSLTRMLPDSAPVLTNLLATGNRETRVAAAQGLREGFLRPKTALTVVVALTNALRDPNGMVQMAAVSSLANSGPQTNLTAPVLLQVSTNLLFHSFIRSLAATGVGGVQGPPLPPRP